MPNVSNAVRYSLAVVVTIAVALFLGSKVGDAINQRKLKKFEATRSRSTEAILAKMENVEIGNHVPNHDFEDLKGNLVKLREVVSGRTAIVFLEPDCPACIEEIERIQEVVKDSAEYRFFVFVSSGNVLHLIDLFEEYSIQSPILYDHNALFTSTFKVWTYPFNMIVNEQLAIEELIPGQLTEEKIKEMINSDEKRSAR